MLIRNKSFACNAAKLRIREIYFSIDPCKSVKSVATFLLFRDKARNGLDQNLWNPSRLIKASTVLYSSPAH